jgi:hypothetical protein
VTTLTTGGQVPTSTFEPPWLGYVGVRGKYGQYKMKKIAIASIVAAGLAGAVLGLASPAQADLGHNIWANNQNRHSGTVPQIDTTVHHSR